MKRLIGKETKREREREKEKERRRKRERENTTVCIKRIYPEKKKI